MGVRHSLKYREGLLSGTPRALCSRFRQQRFTNLVHGERVGQEERHEPNVAESSGVPTANGAGMKLDVS